MGPFRLCAVRPLSCVRLLLFDETVLGGSTGFFRLRRRTGTARGVRAGET